jgi:hypothetical protein
MRVSALCVSFLLFVFSLIVNTCNGQTYNALVRASYEAARQGENVTVLITLVDPKDALASGATEIVTTMTYNPALLIYKNASITTFTSLGTIGMRIPIGVDTVIARINFEAALGNDSVTALTLATPSSNSASLNLTKADGQFKLLNVCYAGGARFLNPSGKASITHVHDNPATDNITFDLNTVEKGITTIRLADAFGRQVRILASEEFTAGDHTLNYDLAGISSGRYFLILETPTVHQTLPVEVIR